MMMIRAVPPAAASALRLADALLSAAAELEEERLEDGVEVVWLDEEVDRPARAFNWFKALFSNVLAEALTAAELPEAAAPRMLKAAAV